MKFVRVSVSTVMLAVTFAPGVNARQVSTANAPRVLAVTNTDDDGGAGTLRWAIEASNATPDRETIAIDTGTARVIALKSSLPPITGPVVIEGTAWKRTGEFAVIDGSGYIAGSGPESCPGATSGQYGANVRTMTSPGLQVIDTADVEISGIEVRRFCIGILINRSTRVLIRDSRFIENRGGAGIMLTGDDGHGNPTSTTTNNNKVLRNEFIDNGDGLELTRGAAFNLIAGNTFRSTPANQEPSQGIEILRGNDNVVSGNRFQGYSDGLQINWGDRNYIVANTFTDNTFGLNLTGIGNIVDSNIITANRIGIVVRPADPSPIVRLTRNRVTGNGRDIRRCEAGGSCDDRAPKGGVIFGLPGLEHESFVGSRGRGVTPNPATMLHICPQHAPPCQSAPNHGLVRPTLTAVRGAVSEMTLTGTLHGSPSSRYVIELFGNASATGDDSELFLDDTAAFTDRSGVATFSLRIDQSRLAGVRAITATMTSDDGATSAPSEPLPIKPSSRRLENQ
jgi:3-dehydroshikimate dehydratase